MTVGSHEVLRGHCGINTSHAYLLRYSYIQTTRVRLIRYCSFRQSSATAKRTPPYPRSVHRPESPLQLYGHLERRVTSSHCHVSAGGKADTELSS